MSVVIDGILMVAITVAIAVTVCAYISDMISGTQDQSANIACITDSSTNKITIASTNANLHWRDMDVFAVNISVNGESTIQPRCL